MVTRQRMAAPAIFALVAVVMLAGLVTLGIVAWHLTASANAPVAVDWGDKICKQLPDAAMQGKCKKLNQVAVDWGDKISCKSLPNGTLPDKCKKPDKVAVDWGNSMCAPTKSGTCGEVFEVAVDWGSKREKP